MAACILQGKTCVCARKTFKPYAYPNAMLWWASSQVTLVNWMQQCLQRARVAQQEAFENGCMHFARENLFLCPRKTFKPYAYPNAMLWWASSQVTLVNWMQQCLPRARVAQQEAFENGCMHFARENLFLRSKNFQTLRLPQCNALVGLQSSDSC